MGQSAETVDFPVNDRFSNEVDIEVLSKFTAALAEPRPQAHKERERETFLQFTSRPQGTRPSLSKPAWVGGAIPSRSERATGAARWGRPNPTTPANQRAKWRNDCSGTVGGREKDPDWHGRPPPQPIIPRPPKPSSFYANRNSTLLQRPSPSDPPIRFFSPHQKTEPSGLSSALPTVIVKPSHFVSLVSRYFFFCFRGAGTVAVAPPWIFHQFSGSWIGESGALNSPPPDPCSLIAAMSNTLLRVYPSDLKMPCKCLYYMDILATVLQHIGLIGSSLPSVCLMP